MERILLTQDLVRQGYDGTEIERLVRSGDLVRLRRGAYLTGAEANQAVGRRAAHRRLIDATVPQCDERTVVSHMSAAVLHGLPTWVDQLTRVQVIKDREGSGSGRRHVRVRGMPLADEDIVVVDGLAVTSLARTVVDLACQLPMRRSVGIGDAALRQISETEPGRDLRAELAAALDRAARRPGVPTARRAIAFLDHRSESMGESVSRVLMHEHGLPAPELQYEIFDDNGYLVARCDFAWLDQQTLGEFDGAVKYTGQFGKSAEKVVMEEKRRENVIRSYGFELARWTWPDLDRPTDLARLIRQSLARGRARSS